MGFNNRPASIVGKMIHSDEYKAREWVVVTKSVPSGIVTDRTGLNVVK